MTAYPCEFDSPHDFEHASRMMPALEAGSVQLVREVFGSLGAPSSGKMISYLNEILDLGNHAEMSAHARAENTLSRPIMAKDEASFEHSLAGIVGIIGQHVDMAEVGVQRYSPPHRAFELYEKPYRLPAALAIMQHTLQSNPAWKPDIQAIFGEIGQEPGESYEMVTQYRDQKAQSINLLGAATSAWLKTSAPDSLKLRMSAVDRTYWDQAQWQTDATQMPWGNGAVIASNNQAFLQMFGAVAGWDAPGQKEKYLESERLRQQGSAALARIMGKSGNNGPN